MFWGLILKLLIGSVVAPVVFSFILMPFFGLTYLITKKNKKILNYLASGLLFIVQAYYWGMWAAYCSNLALSYSEQPEINYKWVCYIVGLLFCLAPISWLTYKEKSSAESTDRQNKIQKGANLYSVITLLAFVVFSIWPQFMNLLYGWFTRIF